MLSVNEIRQRLADDPDMLRSFGVDSLWVFGSVARNDGVPGDVDLLVSFEHPPTLMDFMGLKFYLEDLLDIPVDLHSRAACPDRFYQRIKKDLQHVA